MWERHRGVARERLGEVAALKSFGEALRDHVRYEERALFGRIEATLDPQELSAVGAALQSARSEHRPPRA